jgi:hypothetical protein
MRSRVAYSHVIWLALRSSLSLTDPALIVQRLQVASGHQHRNIIVRCWEDAINGVLTGYKTKQLFSWMYRCT